MWDEFLDWIAEYDHFLGWGLITFNSVIILLLLIAKSRKVDVHGEIEQLNIAFTIAHPDDESMFFLPAIKSLSKKHNLYLLCLSNGDFDGLGKTREKELEKAAAFLKFKKLKIVDDLDLPDGMNAQWSQDKIAKYVTEFVDEHKVNVLISFDQFGVSGHPNHISVFHGTREALKQLKKQPRYQDMSMFSLITTGFVRKYIGIFDAPLTMLNQSDYYNWNPFTAYTAMKCHWSQFVWFRKLFIIFSRYAYMNSFEEVPLN
mmetsp:Transcript_43/g.46  ORF Transcript_43/g.46 Transcript_43/m.46 type:complete len:259 (+) Transcript_43:104-880(+)